MPYPVPTQFTRYELSEMDEFDLNKLLQNGTLQAHFHNVQCDYAEAMTALIPWEAAGANEYRLRMAYCQGAISALQKLLIDNEDRVEGVDNEYT